MVGIVIDPGRPVGAHQRATMLTRYRGTGADLPFMDPCGYHGVAMEGYFWRLTHVASRTVIVVLAGVNRDGGGDTWGTVGIAGHPGGFSRSLAVDEASGAPRGVGVWAGEGDRTAIRADERSLTVDLGAGARLDARFQDAVGWPRGGAFGGIGPAQAIPGLSQYWHPYMLGGRVTGRARLGDREVDLDGATVYAEKNWGRGGFPPAWWWGQAHGFEREDVCVAFAGGRAGLGPIQVLSTTAGCCRRAPHATRSRSRATPTARPRTRCRSPSQRSAATSRAQPRSTSPPTSASSCDGAGACCSRARARWAGWSAGARTGRRTRRWPARVLAIIFGMGMLIGVFLTVSVMRRIRRH
jgi:hypothetical protein